MKLTTGYEFQGYYITEYYDVIFDEMLVGLGAGRSFMSALDNAIASFAGSEATIMIDKLNEEKANLRNRVIKKAAQLGANALIGIDFESSKLGDLMMISMTATAVKIEKIAEGLPVTEKQLYEQEEEKMNLAKREEQRKAMVARAEILNTENISKDDIIGAIKSMNDANEMREGIIQLAEKNPNLFSEEFIQSLDTSVEVGRIYGRSVGADNFIQKLTSYLNVE